MIRRDVIAAQRIQLDLRTFVLYHGPMKPLRHFFTDQVEVASFDEYIVTRPEASFLLQVKGDSMIGAGILDKDLVIVENGREPQCGDVVLAEIDGNWTIKYFRKKGDMVILEAANPKYPAFVPQRELNIRGVITALVRKYHR